MRELNLEVGPIEHWIEILYDMHATLHNIIIVKIALCNYCADVNKPK